MKPTLARARREAAGIDDLVSAGNLDDRTLWALAGHLQAFYTGCETVVGRVLETFDGWPDGGRDSHVRLLQQANLDVPGVRPPVLSSHTVAALHPYQAFRHFFRHAYGVDLEWAKMASKAENAAAVFARFEDDILRFTAFLRAAADS